MSRARGHLRLVGPDETLPEVLASLPPVASHPGPANAALWFHCPVCDWSSWTDRPVRERWCTGGHRGVRTHPPVEMERTELRD